MRTTYVNLDIQREYNDTHDTCHDSLGGLKSLIRTQIILLDMSDSPSFQGSTEDSPLQAGY